MTSDIIVVRTKDRTIFIGDTPKGMSWLKNNITRNASMTASVQSELADELIADMKNEGLEVQT